jgi:hypothetical protein
MAISRVPGYSLLANLDRQGTDIYISSNGQTLIYWDVNNYKIGVNTDTPQQELHVSGNILVGNGHVYTGANLQFDLGSPTNQWRSFYGGNVYATLATPTQPYITSLGNLTTLNVAGTTTLSNTFVSSGSTISAGNNRITWIGTPSVGTDAATKAYVDSAIVGAEVGNVIPLGTPTDGNLADNNAAYLGFTTSTTVTDAIDILNSVTQNLFTNTFVRSVSFSSNVTAGGAGQTVLLTMVPQGNVNQYVIQWGDGTANTTTSSTTTTHTYATNTGTPFTIVVQANNTNGASPSNVANAVRTSYIQIYSANPIMGYNLYRTNTNGTVLSGSNLYAIQGNLIYLQNTTTNTNTATVTWSVSWGDGNIANIATNSSPGGVLGANLSYTYTSNSSTGQYGVNLALLTDNIANPSIIPMYSNIALKVYANSISVPAGVNTKLLTVTNTSGTSPYLAYGYADNTGSTTTLTAGTSVSRISIASTALVGSAGNVTTAYSYNANVGYLNAVVNSTLAGNINLSTQTATTLVGNIGLSGIVDFNLYNSAGAGVSFATSTYYPGLYYGLTANVQIPVVKLSNGVSRFGIYHTTTGVTNNVDFVVDNVTSTPLTTAGFVANSTNGTYRYISGIPYYNTGSPTINLGNVTVANLTGQTYNNTTTVFTVATGQYQEGTSSAITGTNTYTYTQISNSSVGILNGSIPYANVGVGNVYTIKDLSVPITASAVRSIANLVVSAVNVNGTSSNTYNITNVQVHTASQSGISEIALSCNVSLGDGTYTSTGIRSTYFLSSTTHNPSYVNSTNFYSTNVYSEASDPGVAGTKEATIRIGVLKFLANNYSTGYLPVGPNRSSDGTSYQYFTFAFQRKGVSSFNLNIVAPGGVANCWIAAPGTTLDSTSQYNGWLRADMVYGGAGKPGSNTGAGGNGSDGVALTSADRIVANTALSGNYKFSLGTESLTNATNNVCLVRIALATGQTVTTLGIV